LRIGKFYHRIYRALLVLGGVITVVVTGVILTKSHPSPEITSAPPTANIQCDETSVIAVAWNPSHNLVACSGESQTGVIQLWDTRRWQPVGQLRGHTGKVYSLSWSPDGTQLASQAEGQTIYIWDAAALQAVTSFQADSINTPTEVAELRWSADGSKLMKIPHSPGTVQIWQIAKGGKPVSVPMGTAVAWSSDERVLAVSSGDMGCVQIWNAVTGEPEHRYHQGALPILSLAWSPTQKIIASAGDEGVNLWNPGNGEILLTLTGEAGINKVLWSPDGEQIAGIGPHRLSVWDSSTGQLLSSLQVDSPAAIFGNQAVWSGDGKMIAFSGGADSVDEWYGKIWAWDVEKSELFAQITVRDPGPCLNWSADSSQLLIVGHGGSLNIWSLPDLALASRSDAPTA
jgi:WD40 repeat protein